MTVSNSPTRERFEIVIGVDRGDIYEVGKDGLQSISLVANSSQDFEDASNHILLEFEDGATKTYEEEYVVQIEPEYEPAVGDLFMTGSGRLRSFFWITNGRNSIWTIADLQIENSIQKINTKTLKEMVEASVFKLLAKG